MIQAKCNILAGIVLALCTHQAVIASPTASSPASPPTPPPLTFAVGDKIKVSFYEPVKDDTKWAALGRLREPGPSFYLHEEISGDYTVASDWTISVPIIGNVVVARRTAVEVEAVLGKDFTKAIGHPGFVNITIVERKPLYVMGWVNKPGVYKFDPDMTPLDLVALAGGYKTSPLDISSGVEAIRESADQIASLDKLRHALAQYAVLKAEINNTQAEPTQQLINLVGPADADVLVREEQAKRTALEQIQKSQVKALQIAVDAAAHTVVIDQGRLQPTKDAIAVRLARLSSLSTLSHQGLLSQPQVEEAQGSVSDSQESQLNVLSAIADDQHQLALAKVEMAKFVAETALNLNQQLDALQREIDNLTPQVTADAEAIRLLAPQDAPENTSAMQFSIVRQGQVIQAALTTRLQPGDVLQVEREVSEPSALVAPGAGGPSGASPFQQSAWQTCPQSNGCF